MEILGAFVGTSECTAAERMLREVENAAVLQEVLDVWDHETHYVQTRYCVSCVVCTLRGMPELPALLVSRPLRDCAPGCERELCEPEEPSKHSLESVRYQLWSISPLSIRS